MLFKDNFKLDSAEMSSSDTGFWVKYENIFSIVSDIKYKFTVNKRGLTFQER